MKTATLIRALRKAANYERSSCVSWGKRIKWGAEYLAQADKFEAEILKRVEAGESAIDREIAATHNNALREYGWKV